MCNLFRTGDFKQLPPATTKQPFICHTSVYENFDFRVLRENRRVRVDAARSAESDDFHAALGDIAWGRVTERVKSLVVVAYVRGAHVGCAERAELEGSTSVFTKRRYRDNWNQPIVKRLAESYPHSFKIRARCRAFYAKGNQWLSERRTKALRRQT